MMNTRHAKRLLAVALMTAATASAANLPWTWDDTKESRSAATCAETTLAAPFASESAWPAATAATLALFDSRLWTSVETALAVFSTLPAGCMVIFK